MLAGRSFNQLPVASFEKFETRGVRVGLFSLLFSYQGRINRLQYWTASLGVGFAGVFAIFAVSMMAFPSAQLGNKMAMAGAAVGMLLTIFVIWMVMAYCAMAIQVKRFHDRGQSGWLSMLPMLPSMAIFYSLITGAISGQDAASVFASVQPWVLLLWAINLFFFINLGCLGGTQGPNKYGDPPGGGSYTPSTPSAPRSSEPKSVSIPGVTAKAQPAQAAFSMSAAQDAIDRAAAKARADAAAARAMPAAAPAAAGAAPAFGRRVTR